MADEVSRASGLAAKHIAHYDAMCARAFPTGGRATRLAVECRRRVLEQRMTNCHLPDVREMVYRRQLKLERRGPDTAFALAGLAGLI